jgi:hypothetical protein
MFKKLSCFLLGHNNFNQLCLRVPAPFSQKKKPWLYLLGPTEYVSFLPNDGDRLQSPKRRVSFFKDRRWIMSRKFVISKIHQ